MVFLSHIEDPHNFYAQRVRQQKLLKDMNGEFENASHLPKLTKDRVNYGQYFILYLCKIKSVCSYVRLSVLTL